MRILEFRCLVTQFKIWFNYFEHKKSLSAPSITNPPLKRFELKAEIHAFEEIPSFHNILRKGLLNEYASLAQGLEHWSSKPGVQSSNL